MKAEQDKLRLNLLQQQLSPHFIFNSLSTLKGLVVKDSKGAIHYIGHLSNITRYITCNIGKDFVLLNECIDFIKEYTQMLEYRFPGHFIFKIEDKSRFMDKEIVPVSLQLAVENVIKHNRHSIAHPLEISVEIREDKLIVKNLLQPILSPDSLGVGLENLNERYKLLTGKELTINNRDNYFIIGIPLINHHESTNHRG